MGFNMMNLCRKVQHITLGLLLLVLPVEAQTIESMVDAVSDSALFSTIAGLQGFGTRAYNSPNAAQVSKWLRAQFLAAGVKEVALDSFVHGTYPQSNVVATLPGSGSSGKEIIVGAHLDSWSRTALAPGADDDASGTAAILEIARVMVSSGYHNSTTIRFVGFAAEEAGLIGSTHYAGEAKAEGRDITLMLNFDMIGYTSSANPERRFNVQGYSPDTETATLVAEAATTYTSLTPVVTIGNPSNVDSHSFAREGYTAVNCIEYLLDFNPFYHSANDLVTALDSSYLRDITRTGLAAVLRFDGMVASTAPPVPLPAVANLEQNYPNPFNPKTVIRFSVPTGGRDAQMSGVSDVKLTVHDLLGREVAVLVNERKAPGSYEVSFDGTGLASGMYVYRMTAGTFAAANRMMLVR